MVGNQTVLSILDEAAAAIGGWTALQSIKRVHLESEGQDWEPWQAYEVGGTVAFPLSVLRLISTWARA